MVEQKHAYGTSFIPGETLDEIAQKKGYKNYAHQREVAKDSINRARHREAAGYELPGHTEKMKEHFKEHQQSHWKQD